MPRGAAATARTEANTLMKMAGFMNRSPIFRWSFSSKSWAIAAAHRAEGVPPQRAARPLAGRAAIVPDRAAIDHHQCDAGGGRLRLVEGRRVRDRGGIK